LNDIRFDKTGNYLTRISSRYRQPFSAEIGKGKYQRKCLSISR